MKDNNQNRSARGIKIKGILHDDKGSYANGEVTAVFSCRSDYDILSVMFEDKIQISVTFVNVEKAIQAADSSFAIGRIKEGGFAIEQVSTVGAVTMGKDKRNTKEGRVLIAVSSNGNDRRISVCFDGRVEIITDLAPILLLADGMRGRKLFS